MVKLSLIKAKCNIKPSQNLIRQRKPIVVIKPVKIMCKWWTRSRMVRLTAPSWSQCPESRSTLDRKSRIDQANMIKTISIFCLMVTSSTLKDSTLIDKAMINLVDIMILSLVTTFLVQSMHTVRFRRTRVTTLVITEAPIRKIVLPDLTTMEWYKTMEPNSGKTTVVSMLIRVKDTTARVSNIQTSSRTEVNQTIRTSKMLKTSPEETRSTRTVAQEVMLSIHLQKTGSREILRWTRTIWTSQQALRTSRKATRRRSPRTAMTLKEAKPVRMEMKVADRSKKKKKW